MLILSIALDCIHLNESFFCDKFIAIDNSFGLSRLNYGL
jgi:hypothetical protein